MMKKLSKNDALKDYAAKLKATPRDDQEAMEAAARAKSATGCSKRDKPGA